MADVFEVKKYLPKCWLAVIEKYWYPTLPIDYPETTTVFDFVTGDDKAAMIEMEKNLGTEDSIISAEDVPDKEAVGAYLGTYDVEGEVGEEVLISPNKLPDNAIGALAYHYDSENDSWDNIDTVEVKDGYVYATLDEFSPIAVFALKRAAYYDTTKSQIPANVYVCNGLTTKVYKNDEDKIVAETDGVITELTEGDAIVGGSYDGTDIESTNLFLNGVKIDFVIGGSWVYGTVDDGVKNHTKSINVKATDCEIGTITGAGIWNCADQVTLNISGCKITRGVGNQMAYYKQHDSNHTLEDSAKLLGANQWVRKSIINIKDSNVYCMYAAGNNGYATTLDATMYAENCEFEYGCNGQSNGTVVNVSSTLKDCKVQILNENNRGYWGNGSLTLKGGNEVDKAYVLGDITDMPTAEVTGKVDLFDVSATDTVKEFYVGAVGNAEVKDYETASKYINAVKISRSANVIYANNADVVLKDILSIK